MQLRDALSDLKEIRTQLDRTREFCGFRSLAVGVSGILVMVGAAIQISWEISVQSSLREFLIVWITVAMGSVVTAGIEMWIRNRYSASQLLWKTHRKLMMQIAPSFFVGAVLTAVIGMGAESAWMLPGTWALIYCLGLFACWNHLPRQTIWGAAYFAVGGSICLAHSFLRREADAAELSAWYMVMMFGGGQFLLGWILYWTLERKQDGQES